METERPIRYGVPGKRWDFMVRRCFVHVGEHRSRGFEILRVRPRGHPFSGTSIGRFTDQAQAHEVAKYLATKDFWE